MKSFPMFFRTTGRRVIIIGGGEQAAQKARLIAKTDAVIVLAAPELDDELSALVADELAQHHSGDITSALFEGAAMAFIATGCPAMDTSFHAIAKSANCPVNVVDQPALCDLTTPAIVDRDPIVVAIGSEGTAPVLTRDIKTKLEAMLPQNLGGLAVLAGRLRDSVAHNVPREKRRAFWAGVFKGQAARDWIRGREREAARSIKAAIAAGGLPEAKANGHLTLVGAGPGARDLLTMRAIQRLQEADVIFYDRLVDAQVLELARRDAERVFVGKHVGAHTWPQGKINQIIVAEALKGRQVVRLKSGDPTIFGRAGEEIAAAEAAGISVEIVPGVTAASAAAAAFGQSLTERGISDTLILTTGMGRDGDPLPDAARHATPGATIALYMSVRQSGKIAVSLMARGLAPCSIVQVAADISKHSENLSECRLDRLEMHLAETGCTGCAMLLVTWAKDAVAGDMEKSPIRQVA